MKASLLPGPDPISLTDLSTQKPTSLDVSAAIDAAYFGEIFPFPVLSSRLNSKTLQLHAYCIPLSEPEITLVSFLYFNESISLFSK